MHSDSQLIEMAGRQPAPFLWLLDQFHRRDDRLTPDAMRAIASGLRMPLADVYGTATFYHHLTLGNGSRSEPRVCTGPVCRLRGSEQWLADGTDAHPMACAGRCDIPVPILQGDSTHRLTENSLEPAARGPLPVPNPGGLPECIFEHIRQPVQATYEGYTARDGFQALDAALDTGPDQLLQTLDDSGLAGRGGAGFPTGRKWRSVREAPGSPKTIVCNADEGEPGCFKDRAILEYDPYAVLEGMILAAFAAGAELGFIYLRYEYPELQTQLEEALTACRTAGLLGPANKIGSDFDIHIRRGAGAYVCGEEGSLLNSLEGKHPFPRNRPPFPVTHGYLQKPTVVNNVETLAAVPHILRHGGEWYRDLGRGDLSGTKVISVSGDVQRPGNYEVPFGFPLSELLYEWAGGPPSGSNFQAASMAGLSGGFLSENDFDVTLDEPSLRSRNSMLGAAGIIVYDDTRDMVDETRVAIEFFAEESCGKCFPCRIGSRRLRERLDAVGPDTDRGEWLDEVNDLGLVMRNLSACGLGVAASFVSDSLVRNFPDQLEQRFEAPE